MICHSLPGSNLHMIFFFFFCSTLNMFASSLTFRTFFFTVFHTQLNYNFEYLFSHRNFLLNSYTTSRMSPAGCAVCGTLANLVCGDCKSTTYCSGACQQKDQALHDVLCGKLEAFIENNPRPTDTTKITHKLGLLLRQQHNDYDIHPDIIWVEMRCIKEIDRHDSLSCDLSKIFDEVKDGPKGIILARNDRKVEIWCSDEYYMPNRNVQLLVSGGMKFKLPLDADAIDGPIVLIGVDEQWDDTVEEYRDFAAADLRVALSYFLRDVYCFEIDDESDLSTTNRYMIFEQPEWIKAVQISSTTEPSLQYKFNLQTIMLNKNHPRLGQYDIKSKVSERMGIPFLFQKVSHCRIF